MTAPLSSDPSLGPDEASSAQPKPMVLRHRIPIVSTTLLISLFLALNIAVIRGVNYPLAQPGSSLSRSISETLSLAATSLLLAELAMAWLWLRSFVMSRLIRMILGLVICHVISLVCYLAIPATLRGVLASEFVFTCLFLYTAYLLQGIFLQHWLHILRLKSLWGEPRARSRLSIVDLFYSTTIAAVLMAEVVLIQKSSMSLDIFSMLFALFIQSLLAIAGALLVTLGLGSFFALRRMRFAICFAAIVLIGPSLCLWILGLFGFLRKTELYIHANVLTWVYVLAVLCVFPLLFPRRQSTSQAAEPVPEVL